MAKENELPDSYEYILDKFGEEKLLSRYTWLYDLMENFLRIKNYEDNVIISSDILNHVVIDYFVDIDRLKLFQNIEKTHESKIYAYSAYWLLRHKPMQVVVTDQGEKYAFVNEEWHRFIKLSSPIVFQQELDFINKIFNEVIEVKNLQNNINEE